MKIYEKEAAKLAEDIISSGHGTDKPSVSDVGVVTMYICMNLNIPISIALPLTRYLEPFFRKGINLRTVYRMGLHLYSMLDRLKEGVIEESLDIRDDFQATLQCTGIMPIRKSKTQQIYRCDFLILNSKHAGIEFTSDIPGGFVSGVLRVISRATRDRPSRHPMLMMGMRLSANLGRNDRRQLIIKEINKQESIAARNSEVRKHRNECPLAPCWECAKDITECRYAVKRGSATNKATRNFLERKQKND